MILFTGSIAMRTLRYKSKILPHQEWV